MKTILKSSLLGFVLCSLGSGTCLAQQGLGEILADDIAENADVSALQAEARSMETISKGITLSLAMCEGIELCSPNVNRTELEQMMSRLDARIGSLSARYDQSGNAELEPVLIAYADMRENYSKQLEKLGTMVVEEPADDGLAEDDFLSGINAAPSFNQVYSVFRDVDEDLTDDVDEEEDPLTGEEPAAETPDSSGEPAE